MKKSFIQSLFMVLFVLIGTVLEAQIVPRCIDGQGYTYNPITGHPSVFRGIDDHRQVWVVDLLARGVAGVHPTAEALVIHPLPMDLDRVGFRGRLRGVDVRVSTVGDDVRASVGGAAYQGRVGTPLRIPW